jgi:hypothetical protein
MKAEKDILEKSIKALKSCPFPSGPDRQTVDATVAALTKASGQTYDKLHKQQTIVERIKIMKTYTKLAIAAMLLIAAVLSITLLNKSATPAYALEQTIQASHSVRYLHAKLFSVSHDKPQECWVEFNPDGQLKNIRSHQPAWQGVENEEKVGVWKENEAQIWLKQENVLFITKYEHVADEVRSTMEQFDPKLAVERLQKEQKEGRIELKITEPADMTEPIVVTATVLKESSDLPLYPVGGRVVFFVDQATRLVNSIELYVLEDGEYKKTMTVEYFDYNQPIDAKMFTLDNIPADVTRIDQTTGDVGLPQNGLTDDEIAVKIVREFFEALIAADYNKAGKLLGVSGEKMHAMIGNVKVLRIISIGPAAPHPKFTEGRRVPMAIEIEKDGKIEREDDQAEVRRLFDRPDMWVIDSI